LLPKQHTKYKTKKLLNTIKLHYTVRSIISFKVLFQMPVV